MSALPRDRSDARTLGAGQQVAILCGAAALLALLAGYLVGDDRKLLTIAIFGLPTIALFALRSFAATVLLIVPAALLLSFSLPTGTESRISIVMLLVLMLSGLWIVAAAVQGGARLVRSPLNRPLIAFLVICCLAFAWSVAFRDPFLMRYPNFTLVQLGALAALVLSPLTTLLIANFVSTPRRLWLVAGPFVAIGGAATLAFVAGWQEQMPNTRGLFSLWFVAVTYALVVAQPRLQPGARLLLIALLAVYAYYVGYVGIAWLSGWVPPLVAMIVITALRSRLALVALVLALVVVILVQWSFWQRTLIEDSEREGDFERLTLWQLNLELVSAHPLLGTGPAGYAIYYMTYHPHEARSTHNNYLDISAQTGLLGSVCWVWLVVAAIREGRAVLRHAPPGSLRTLGLATCGGLVGAASAMALGDWVLPFAYNQGIEGFRYTVFSWIFLGVLISIRHQVAPLAAPEPPHGRRHA